MKKFIQILIIATAILIVAGTAFAIANWKHISSFPHIISSFYSKEFCSCYFVVGRSEAFCHNYARQYVPISEFSLDESSQSVTVTGLGITTTSAFVSEKYGCVIQGAVD